MSRYPLRILLLIFLLLALLVVVFLVADRRVVVYDTPREDSKNAFLSTFCPFLTVSDVSELKFARQGIHEPKYIAMIRISGEDREKLIQMTTPDASWTVFDREVQTRRRMIKKARWWKLNDYDKVERFVWRIDNQYVAFHLVSSNICFVMARIL